MVGPLWLSWLGKIKQVKAVGEQSVLPGEMGGEPALRARLRSGPCRPPGNRIASVEGLLDGGEREHKDVG